MDEEKHNALPLVYDNILDTAFSYAFCEEFLRIKLTAINPDVFYDFLDKLLLRQQGVVKISTSGTLYPIQTIWDMLLLGD